MVWLPVMAFDPCCDSGGHLLKGAPASGLREPMGCIAKAEAGLCRQIVFRKAVIERVRRCPGTGFAVVFVPDTRNGLRLAVIFVAVQHILRRCNGLACGRHNVDRFGV